MATAIAAKAIPSIQVFQVDYAKSSVRLSRWPHERCIPSTNGVS